MTSSGTTSPDGAIVDVSDFVAALDGVEGQPAGKDREPERSEREREGADTAAPASSPTARRPGVDFHPLPPVLQVEHDADEPCAGA
jgi:hypothetical protein